MSDTTKAAKAATPAKTVKTVAILSATAPLAEAIKRILQPRINNAKFLVVSKVTEVPEATDGPVAVASLGIPNFLPTDRVSEVVNINTAYEADPAIRTKNWNFIRSENGDPEDIVQLLSAPDHYKVIPLRRALTVRMDYAEARVEFAEAETTEDKLAAMTKMRDIALSVSALG